MHQSTDFVCKACVFQYCVRTALVHQTYKYRSSTYIKCMPTFCDSDALLLAVLYFFSLFFLPDSYLFPNSVRDVFSWVTNFVCLFFIHILIFFRLHFSCCRHDDTLSILVQNSFRKNEREFRFYLQKTHFQTQAHFD